MRRPSPSFVLAVLALAVALGGTAVAAKRYVITSTKQISPSVLRQLRGATGPAGPVGLAGARGQDGAGGAPGAPGAPGVTSVVTATGGAVTLHPTADVGRAVVALQPLAEGSWLVVGTADVAGAGEPGEQVRCSILAGGAEAPGSSAGGEHTQVTTTAPLVLAGPANVSLLCRHNGAGATLPSLGGARLYAIRTAELDRREP